MAAAQPPKPEAVTESLDEQIRRRAYEIFLARGGHAGSDQDDWIQAEQELTHTADETSLARAEEEGFFERK